MPLSINDTLQNNSPKPLDNKYGIFSTGVFRPYASIAEANATISASYRSIGLTVIINTGGGNIEHWYQGGLSDGSLVPKGTTPTVTTPLTLSSGIVGIQQANGSQAGYLGSSDWSAFNSKLGGVSSLGSGTSIYASTSSGTANLRSLVGAGGLVITNDSNTITLTPSPAGGVNIGSGAGIFSSVSGLNLQLRSIIGTGGIGVTQNTSDITLTLVGQSIPTPVTTPNATPTTLSTISISSGTAGLLMVTLVAVVSGNSAICSMAQRYVKYYKTTGGSLTILETGDIISESLSTLTTATWSLVGASNNIAIQITGEGTNNIKWSATIQNYTNS